MSVTRRGAAQVVAAIAVLAVLAGCASMSSQPQQSAPPAQAQPSAAPAPSQAAAQAAPSQAPQKLTPIKAVLPTLSSLSYLPELFAREKGFFKAAGLDVDLSTGDSDVSLAALRSGDVVASGATSTAIRAAAEGFPVTLALATTRYAPWSLFVTPDIKSFQDLKGKPVGVSGTQSITKNIIEELLQKHGMTLQDVQMLVTGSMGNQLTALKGGSVKAAVLSIPSDVQARAAGFVTLAGPAEMPPSVPGGASVSTEYAAKHPEIITAYVGAVVRSIQYLVDPKNTQEVITYMAKQFKLEEQVASEIWVYFKDSMATDGTVPDETIKLELQRAGKDASALEKVRDWTYVRAAAKTR